MRWLVAAAAVVAAVVPAVAPAHAERIARAESAVFVPADGATVTSLMPTALGATYEITVSGTYAYTAFGGLADCGYHDTNAAAVGQDWEGGGPRLLVEGMASCGFYTATHTYTFTWAGTGSAYEFRIDDPTGHADNAGGLTVTVTTKWDVDANCHFVTTGHPNSTVAEVTLVAEAHQTGAPSGETALTTTYVSCRLLRNGVEVDAVQAWGAGVATGPAVSTVRVPFGAFQTCLHASVHKTFTGTVVERRWCP